MTWRVVTNKDRKFGAEPHYWRTSGPDGQHVLFTMNELKKATERAKANPEDVVQQKPAAAKPWYRMWW